MKTILKDIVEIFYQSPFKIFNINTLDGETLVKPLGYFISLGITTPLESLAVVRDYISRSDYGLTARLVEIRSIKSEKYGDYLNLILPTPEDELKKYPSPLPNDLLGETGVEEYLKELQKEIQGGDLSNSLLIKLKLTDALDKINGKWDLMDIQLRDGIPVVYHKYVNYKRENNSEYRIGIYATKL